MVSGVSSRSGGFGRSIEQGEKSLQDRDGRRGAAGNMEIDGDNLRDPSDHRVAAGETSAIPCAISQGNDPFRVRRGMISSFQGIAHIFGHRSRDHEDVGVARRGDEPDTEAFDIVIGIAQRMDLQLATIA